MLPLDLCYVIHLCIIVWPGHWRGIWCTKPQTGALTLCTNMRFVFFLFTSLFVSMCVYVSRFFLQFFIPTARMLTEAEMKSFILGADGNSDGRLGVEGQFLIYLYCVCTNIYILTFFNWDHQCKEPPALTTRVLTSSCLSALWPLKLHTISVAFYEYQGTYLDIPTLF